MVCACRRELARVSSQAFLTIGVLGLSLTSEFVHTNSVLADYEQAHMDDIADDFPYFSSSVSCIVEHCRSCDVIDVSSDDELPF